MSTVPSTDITATHAHKPGLGEWLRNLLQSLFGGAKTAAADQSQSSGYIEADEDEDGPYVIAPGGYRIRVPREDRVNSSVGDMMPAVREGLALLPPLPVVVIDLLREIQDPKSTASSVAQIAASDPALAASLIRAVNAAAMGLSRKINSASEAVSYLGFGAVKSIVVRLRLEQVLQSRSAVAALEAEDLWVHSLGVSYAAECLARRVGGVDAGFCATLGLLHDIGKLAINAQFPEHAARLREYSEQHPLEREHDLMGVDHAGLGADLAAKWKLPADLVQSIRYHHRPAEAFHPTDPLPVRQAVHVVHLADQLVKYCYPHSDQMDVDEVTPAEFALLGLEASLPKLLDDKMRHAIARAVLFAEANTKRPASAKRRFLRLLTGDAANRAANAPQRANRIEIDDAAVQKLLADDVRTIKIGTLVEQPQSADTEHTRFVFPASETGVEKAVKAVSAQMQAMELRTELRSAAALVTCSLLPNLLAVNDPREMIEVAQAYTDGTLRIAIRAPGLATARRAPQAASSDAAVKLAEAELAHVLNLGLFSKISISTDGSAVVFEGK